MPQSSSPARGPGLRIATISGVPVYIGASWLLLAAVIVLISASNLSELGTGAYVVGAAFAVSLLAAVLLHEGAHAVAARMVGLPVHRVVADLWGGHTAYDGRDTTPGKAALIAVVGPLTNLLLGVSGLTLGYGLDGIPGLIVHGIGLVNVFLAIFNLLPGLPLDGGQLVDALVWKVSGERSTGLIAAGWCGRIVTVLVLAWVVVRPILRGGSPSATSVVWSLLIAGFMWTGATGAIKSGQARKVLSRSTLGQIARRAREWPSGTALDTVLASAEVPLLRLGDDWAIVGPPDGSSADGVPDGALIDSYATRLPAGSVIEAPPSSDLTPAVLAVQNTGWGLVVLTTDHAPYAVITLEDLNRALEPSGERSGPH